MSSFLDRLKASAKGMVTTKHRREKVRQSIVTNRWDERIWQEARHTDLVDRLISDLSIGDTHKGGERQPFDPAPYLVKDLYMALYKAAPRVESARAVELDVYPARRILDEMLGNGRLAEFQPLTNNDPVMSTVALNAMGDQVREILTRLPPPPPPPQPKPRPQPKQKPQKSKGEDKPDQQPGEPGDDQQPGEPGGDQQEPGQQGEGSGQGETGQPQESQGAASGGAQQGDQDGQPEEGGSEGGQDGDDQDGEPEPGEGEGESGDGEPEGNPDEGDGDDGEGEGGEGDFSDDLTDTETDDFDPDAAMDEAEDEWRAAYDEALDEAGIDRAMNKALDAASDEVANLDSLRRSVGCEDGEWKTMSPEERLRMAEWLRTPEMKELADALGRMKRFAMAERAHKIIDVPQTPYDVTTGNDLPHMLVSELALMGHEVARYEFYRRYADKQLLQYKLRGTEQAGKGPIVILIDKSLSMKGARMHWSLGVSEALRRAAADEDREFYAMFFSTNDDRTRFHFPKGKGPWEQIKEFLSCKASGGTHFDGVLTEGLAKASTVFDGEQRGKADIVLVTDGESRLSEDWIAQFNAERARIGVRVYSVYIGGASDMSGKTGPLGLLQQISDVTIPVKELRPESARQIFARV